MNGRAPRTEQKLTAVGGDIISIMSDIGSNLELFDIMVSIVELSDGASRICAGSGELNH
jgi:hypothetical protein